MEDIKEHLTPSHLLIGRRALSLPNITLCQDEIDNLTQLFEQTKEIPSSARPWTIWGIDEEWNTYWICESAITIYGNRNSDTDTCRHYIDGRHSVGPL